MVGQHVHLVDHIDLEARITWCVHRLFQQLRHLVDAAVGRRIHLDVIDKAARIDRGTRLAHATRRGRDAARAVRPDAIERLGQDARQRGLAHAAGSGKQISMVQPAAMQSMRQRAHDVLLADERFKIPGAIFTGEDLIGHAEILP